MTALVDDPYFGLVREARLRPLPAITKPRPQVPLCQRSVLCDECGQRCDGVAALVHHVADNRCHPKPHQAVA